VAIGATANATILIPTGCHMLECKIRQNGDVTVIDFKGAITLGETVAHDPETSEDGARPIVVGEIVRDLMKRGRRNILINLKDVSFIDSSGIGELVGAYTSVQANGGQLKLLNPVAKVVSVLRLTRLDHLLAVANDEAAAVRSFASAG